MILKCQKLWFFYGNIDLTFFYLPMGASFSVSGEGTAVYEAKLLEQFMHAMKT